MCLSCLAVTSITRLTSPQRPRATAQVDRESQRASEIVPYIITSRDWVAVRVACVLTGTGDERKLPATTLTDSNKTTHEHETQNLNQTRCELHCFSSYRQRSVVEVDDAKVREGLDHDEQEGDADRDAVPAQRLGWV